MEGVGGVVLLALGWAILAPIAALAVGRVVRRGDEEMRFFGSLHAPQPRNRPRRSANRSTTDRDSVEPDGSDGPG